MDAAAVLSVSIRFHPSPGMHIRNFTAVKKYIPDTEKNLCRILYTGSGKYSVTLLFPMPVLRSGGPS